MHPVSLEDVVSSIRGIRRLPRRAVLITFDDGDRSVYDVARPILQTRGLPAVAFVIAGLLDTHHPYWWDEVRSLARPGVAVGRSPAQGPDELVRRLKRVRNSARLALMEELRRASPLVAPRGSHLGRDELPLLESAGIAVANHTLTHPCLSRCADEGVVTEIMEADRALASSVGHPITAFAYPDGDRDARAAQILSRAGYQAAFLFDHRLADPKLRDPYNIPRLRMNSMASMDRFRIIVSGCHPAIHHLLGRS